MCACFLYHWLWNGRRGWFDTDWTVGLLTATYYNAEAQTATPQAWCVWLGVRRDDDQAAMVRLTGGMN